MALQTFPKGAKVWGNYREAQQQIGNAVPSLLVEVLAQQTLAIFFGKASPEPPRPTVRPKLPVPDPQPVGEVPEKHLALVGEGTPPSRCPQGSLSRDARF